MWLKSLLDWLKQVLGIRPAVSAIEILEEYHSRRVSVFRIRNEQIPGCIEFWKVDHHDESSTFWIACINLSQLRTALSQLGVSQRDFLHTHQRGLAATVERQLQEQGKYLASHYWVCGITKPSSGIDPKGRRYKSYRTIDLCLLAGDFQGVAGDFAGDRYIRRFAREVASRVANCEFREYRAHQSWTAAVRSIDWLSWLEGLATGTKGIDLHHRLQVRKARVL